MNLPPPSRLHLVRHGETVWSVGGRHTSRTDVPLTARGEAEARQIGARFRGRKFSHAFTSPRLRARQTCQLAGLSAVALIEPDLREWDYGDYEGLTSVEIRTARAGWNLFVDGAPAGESPEEVFARAERFVHRVAPLEGDIAVFSHGHFLRVLAAAWVHLPVVQAQRLYLGTGSLSVLSYEHEQRDSPVISLWNEIPSPQT